MILGHLTITNINKIGYRKTSKYEAKVNIIGQVIKMRQKQHKS